MDFEELEGMAAGIERELELRSGFFAELVRETDWSFVIKTHALIEAAVSHLLTMSLSTSHLSAELRRPFDRLPLSDPRAGKVAFAEAMGLLKPGQVRFIRAFSELRNAWVHHVHNVNAQFADHMAGIGDKRRHQLLRELTAWVSDQEARAEFHAEAEENPKRLLWFGTLSILLSIERQLGTSRAERLRTEQLLSLADTMLQAEPKLDPDFNEDPDENLDREEP